MASLEYRSTFLGIALLFACCALAIIVEGLGSHVSREQFLQVGGINTSTLTTLNFAVVAFPVVIGVFIGAPLLAREFESGSFRFTWTQSVGRVRFTIGMLGVLAAVSVAAASALGALLGWYAHSFEDLGVESAWQSGFFSTTPLLLPAWTMLSLALGTLLGMVVRRTVAAMAVTAAVTTGLLVAFFTYLLKALLSMAPVVVTGLSPAGIGLGNLNTAAPSGSPAPAGSWLIRSWLTTPNGQPISGAAANQVLYQWSHLAGKGGSTANGAVFWVSYQPGNRFWTFQIVAAALIVVLAGTAAAEAFRRLRRSG